MTCFIVDDGSSRVAKRLKENDRPAGGRSCAQDKAAGHFIDQA